MAEHIACILVVDALHIGTRLKLLPKAWSPEVFADVLFTNDVVEAELVF